MHMPTEVTSGALEAQTVMLGKILIDMVTILIVVIVIAVVTATVIITVVIVEVSTT